MANITPNPAAGRLSGAIGDLVFARLKNGKVIVRQRPVRTTEKKAGEIANQEAFIRAVAYAKSVWNSQPELQAKYKAAAQQQGRQGFHLAKADFRLPPKIGDVDLSGYRGNPGDVIRVVATDDFEVKEVLLVLRRLSGDLIEQGAAVLETGDLELSSSDASACGRDDHGGSHRGGLPRAHRQQASGPRVWTPRQLSALPLMNTKYLRNDGCSNPDETLYAWFTCPAFGRCADPPQPDALSDTMR